MVLLLNIFEALLMKCLFSFCIPVSPMFNRKRAHLKLMNKYLVAFELLLLIIDDKNFPKILHNKYYHPGL